MIILYLALLVVIIGVIFVITSVEVVRPGQKSAKSGGRADMIVNKGVTPVADYTGEDSTADDIDFSEIGSTETSVSEDIIPGRNLMDDSSFEVVLYNDENGISLNEGDGFNSDLASLKNVVRVGRGIAEVGSDGITIRIEKTLYRFDYYRLGKIISRENHAVLSIVGASGSHIIVSDHGAFPEKLKAAYTTFQGKKQ